MDEVFRALADPSRRQLLDALNARNGQSQRELCATLTMARQSVSKHLAVLLAANLVTTSWRGREKLHFLNAEPINAIADRWIGQYDRERVRALADLKFALEESSPPESGSTESGSTESASTESERSPMSTSSATQTATSSFTYTTFISSTPEQLWRALTEPAFTRRYWGQELRSSWEIGAPILQGFGDGEFTDQGQRVLEYQPHSRLSYSWHSLQPEHAEHFGWSDTEFAEYRREQQSRVTFDIEPAGDGKVKLTVVHDELTENGMMYRAISGQLAGSGGWPELLSDLKTLLESDHDLPDTNPA